jgi:hypothetical protein
LRILDALTRGAPLKAIADQEGVTFRRMRSIVNALLAENVGLEPASGFAQAQIRRLDAALAAALRTLGHGEPSAVERVVRVVARIRTLRGNRKPPGGQSKPAAPNNTPKNGSARRAKGLITGAASLCRR